MTIRFHDTRHKEKVEFVPLEEGKVRMYNCGPTVYNFAHIGNFRSFLLADLLRRFLDWKGFAVTQIMNLTDVGHLTEDDVDRMEVAAGRESKDPFEIADRYARAFLDDARALGLRPAHRYPKATDHIAEMIEIGRTLEEKGYAYVGGDSVYFEVRRFADYGALSGKVLDELQAGARVEVNPDKRDPLDFALWKKDPKHLMQWDSPWGRGFPGWHLECSAMAMKYLGPTIDIHTGGEDNIFPHHESEIAQSEAATGQPFVRHWLHTRHLMVGGRKMSKSLDNFFTIRDLLEAGFDGRTIRWALMDGHYRQPHNFNVEGTGPGRRFVSLDDAAGALSKIDNLRQRVRFARGEGHDPEIPSVLDGARSAFDEALSDDLNISEARRAIFDLVADLNRRDLAAADRPAIEAVLGEFDDVLGLGGGDVDDLPDEVRRLIDERQAARQARDFEASDRLRDRILELGWSVEDSPRGPVWRPV